VSSHKRRVVVPSPRHACIDKAKEKEKSYDWLAAVDFYEKASSFALRKKDFLEAGEIRERIGYCLYRAAFQAENQKEFKERMQRAIEAYEKANGFYEKTAEEKAAWMFRCEALTKYLGYWLASDPSEKRKLLDECLKLEGEALAAFSESGNMLEYGRTYNELSLVSYLRGVLEWDRQTLKSIIEKGLKWGEKTVVALSNLGDQYETARAYFSLATCLTLHMVYLIAEPEEKHKIRLKIVKYLSKAVDLSEKVGDAYVLGLSHGLLGFSTRREESVRHLEKTLECGKQTRDNFLIAWGVDFLTVRAHMKAIATEDPEKRKKLAKEAMQFYDKAHHHYSIISFLNPTTLDATANYAGYYWCLAMWETAPKKRREFIEKAERAGLETLKIAEDSEMPNVVLYALDIVSRILVDRARMEPEFKEKRDLLEKALKYREKTIKIHGQLPFDYLALGFMLNYLADIKAELAAIEPNLDGGRRLLEEAVLTKGKCLELCNKGIPFWEKMGAITLFVALRGSQDTYATLLTHLYNLTNKPDHLKKAIEIQQKAIESASKVDMVSRIAESYWKIARAQDVLGKHLEAAESFEHASKSYMGAAEKIPQLKDFYQDHASYMQAWNEIEKAKHRHAEKRYGRAKEHYEKAADLHKSTERWNYLRLNYLAWGRLEEAEDLSRGEQTKEARNLFQQAAELFVEAEKSIKAKLERIEARDEKEMAAELVKASHIRREYCLGRIALEEAKILDRKGDHIASSKQFGFAAEMFKEIAKVESEQSRKELQPVIYLCRAWQKMMEAEAKASSTMYGEAAELFKQAKEHALDKLTSLLALANSSFCKALEAGTRFEATGDMNLYFAAIQHLTSAANYYYRAGFKTASEYAKATQRLFDAYVYMDKANKETDPEKKARYCMMAEKVLQASVGSYLKAKHPEKSEEIRRLLESIREERQLAMSLTEVLHAPTIASTTTSFSTPTPTHEEAVGLERFEHANVQANLILHEKEIRVGEDFTLEMQIVNVGKEVVLLAKVEEILPAGFQLVGKPDYCYFEDMYLAMKGKRLGPLKTEEIRLVLRSFDKGTFEIKPRITYVDETGRQMVSESEPVEVEISEIVLPSRITTGYRDLETMQ